MHTVPTILIVDDEEQNIELARIVLHREGYTLFSATGAKEALDILNNKKIDVLVLDLMMDEMDGFEMLAHLREKNSEIKTIVVSALSDDETISRARTLGAQGYLSKPYEILSLKKEVAQLLLKHIDIEEFFESMALYLTEEKRYQLSRDFFTQATFSLELEFLTKQTKHPHYTLLESTNTQLQRRWNALLISKRAKDEFLDSARLEKEAQGIYL